MAVAREERADILAIGGRRRSRVAGMILAGAMSTVLDAPCSVLLATIKWGEEWYPRRIVVGLDGSSYSLEALTADLVVIGSRGRHGIRAPGSVGERVAHRARCSVLLVRALSLGSPVEAAELVEERTDP